MQNKTRPAEPVFFFASKAFEGRVYGPADWRELLQGFSGCKTKILSARASKIKRSIPSFGFGVDYTGNQTLGEWLEEIQMDIDRWK